MVGIRELGEAIVILVGAICAFRHCRRLPSRSALVLCTTIAGLGVTIIRPLLGPQFPMLLAVLVGFIWLGIWIARWRARIWTA